ncbi:hypothetical protein HK099_004776 [Clydaea vesicula]|uniref:Exostosin GT47 domain-containing protein n=1 Tax=Clydaea vesicula TaxID=447962 RepID=A0AAD5XY06_9FUNG|nr:hypothetical protein HK099_004776 [Clydaea vesicula]
MYYIERLFPKILKKSVYKTKDPQSANFFFVESYTTCVYHNCHFNEGKTTDECKLKTGDYLEKIIKYIRSYSFEFKVNRKDGGVEEQNSNKISYWDRNGGLDHIFVFSWDQASEILGWNHPIRQLVKPSIHLTTFGTIENHSNFNSHKDVVIPPYSNYELQLKKVEGFEKNYQKYIKLERKIFAYFRGTFIKDHKYSKGVRQFLWEIGKTHGEKFKIFEFHSENYWNEMFNSTFSLCPQGWSPWSPRLFDSMIAGTIPDGTKLPFETTKLDYSSFSLKLLNKNVHMIKEVLERNFEDEKKILRLRRNLYKYRKEVVWYFSEEEENFDVDRGAFGNVMLELKKKGFVVGAVGNLEYW